MTENEKEMMNSIFAKIAELDYIKPDEIPNIALYMDQVTTFMEDNLASTKRHDDDKILTKTMINNYAKNKLLPPPEKKRYSREHLLMLIFIYYFKNILSISDIQTLLGPITEKYFKSVTEKDMTYIYQEVFSMEQSQIRYLEKDLMRRFKSAGEIFEDADPEDKEFLHQFSFICLLSFDVYMKKMIIENMIDHMNSSKDTDSSKKTNNIRISHPVINVRRRAHRKKRQTHDRLSLFRYSIIRYHHGMDVSLILLRRPAPRYPSSYVQIPSHNHHFHSSGNGSHG